MPATIPDRMARKRKPREAAPPPSAVPTPPAGEEPTRRRRRRRRPAEEQPQPVKIDADLARALVIVAKNERTTIGKLISPLIRQWMEQRYGPISEIRLKRVDEHHPS